MSTPGNIVMWGICGVCTLALTARFAIFVPVFAPVRPRLARWEYRRPQGTAGH